jgi:hypothetical protein
MRASDQDRQEAVLALSDEYAEGRLDRDEFDRRQALAQEATYLHDLDPLFADLPGRVSPTRRAATAVPAPRVGGRAGLRPRRAHRPPVMLAFVLAMVVLGVVTGSHVLWLLVVPALWFAVAMRVRRHAFAYAAVRGSMGGSPSYLPPHARRYGHHQDH